MKKLIASHTNPVYGDCYVGFKGRDEDFVSQGFYKMEGETIEDLVSFIPPDNITTHFAEEDVQQFVNEAT